MDEYLCHGLPDLPTWNDQAGFQDNRPYQYRNHSYDAHVKTETSHGQYSMRHDDAFLDPLCHAEDVQYSVSPNLPWENCSTGVMDVPHRSYSPSMASQYDSMKRGTYFEMEAVSALPPLTLSTRGSHQCANFPSTDPSGEDNNQPASHQRSQYENDFELQEGMFSVYERTWLDLMGQDWPCADLANPRGSSIDASAINPGRWLAMHSTEPCKVFSRFVNGQPRSSAPKRPGEVAIQAENCLPPDRSMEMLEAGPRLMPGCDPFAPSDLLEASGSIPSDTPQQAQDVQIRWTRSAPRRNRPRVLISATSLPNLTFASAPASAATGPKSKSKKSASISSSPSPTPALNSTDYQQPAEMCAREARDDFLVKSKLSGMSYKDIKAKGRFAEAESTLRGRFRALTKPKVSRLRRPQWTEADLLLLQEAVHHLCRQPEARSKPTRSSAPVAAPARKEKQPKTEMSGSADARPPRAPEVPSPLQNQETSSMCSPLAPPPRLRPLPPNFDAGKIPWKRVAEYIGAKGRYHFGYATCRRKWDEISGTGGNGGVWADEGSDDQGGEARGC